jgi:hypothetical protein
MVGQVVEGDIVALQTALSAFDISLSYEHIAREIDRPFLLTGSAEWLDRSIIQLYPRMQTDLPDELFAFRLRTYSQLCFYGVRFAGVWCRDRAMLSPLVESPYDQDTVYILLCHTDRRIPVLFKTEEHVVSLNDSAVDWNAEVAACSAPNGFFVVTVTRSVTLPGPTPREYIRRARQKLEAQTIFRFSTPTHPIRVYQAWHLGHASLEIIAIAAEEAAPLAIVSDTVAQVFATFHARAQLAYTHIEVLEHRDGSTTQRRALYDALKSKYFDVFYLLELACTQFPIGVPVRALTRAEGMLLAEVCRDARLVYADVCRDMELLEGE